MLLWFDILMKIVVGATILLEIYLLWLIARKTPECMAVFRFALAILVQNELCFTLAMGVLLDAEVLFPITGAAVNGPIRVLGPNSGRYGFALSIFFGAGAFWTQIYCLLFRFTAIQQRFDNLHNIFNHWLARIFFSLIGHAVMVVCGYAAFYCIASPEEASAYVQNAQLWAPRESVEYLTRNDSTFFIMAQNFDDVEMFAIVVMGGFVLASLFSICFSIIIYCTIQANARHFSVQTYKLHKQLTMLLLIQVVEFLFSSPILFLAVPIVWTIVNAALGISEEKWMGDGQMMLLCLYTFVNSAVTLAFIGPYRHFTLQLMRGTRRRCSWMKSVTATVAPENGQQQLQQTGA